jgi:hypothetical protein
MLHLSQSQAKGTLQATSGTKAAQMANNPKAIPVAVMYAPIVFLLIATGFKMAGVSRLRCCDIVQTHFSCDPPDEGHTALQGGMREEGCECIPSRVGGLGRGSEVTDLSPAPLLVPPVLAGFRAEVDNIEASTVRAPQRLRYMLLML